MNGGEADRLAPVTYLPGAEPVARAIGSDAVPPVTSRRPVAFREEYWADDDEAARVEPEAGAFDPADEPPDRERQKERAVTALTRSLGRRGISLSEARARLRADGLSDEDSAQVIDDFVERGWLDDALLAEQLVHTGVDRKGQGRRVIAQSLTKRGIPRDVADAALAALPDDDFERALEFARGKARSFRSLDRETALRRLTGQLARRGYGGSVAMGAARAALDEGDAGSSGVRFR